jgi:site-specific recombinase XerD
VVDGLSSVGLMVGDGVRVQQVSMPGREDSWTVVDRDGAVIEPAEAFLAHLAATERSPNTVRAYAFDLRDFFVFLGQRDASWQAVTVEVLGRFAGWLRLPGAARDGSVVALPPTSAGLSASTVNRKLAAVSSFFVFHHQRGAIVVDGLMRSSTAHGAHTWRPFLAHLGQEPRQVRAVALPASRRLPNSLSWSDACTVVGSCERLRDRLLFAVLRDTGLRVGEALGLRHEDMDVAGRTVAVRPRRNSNGCRAKSADRDVPAPAPVMRLYADYLHSEYGTLDSDYVFVNLFSGVRGEALRYSSVYDLVQRLRERTGIRFGPHSFRHTYATELLRRRVPAEVVQVLMGHASYATTVDTYAHLKIEDARAELERAGFLTAATAAPA